MNLSLFAIEESLALLAETREAAEADGDTAAVEQCDKALAEYLDKSAAKVDSYAALIHRSRAEAQTCADEIERLTARFKRTTAFVDRLRANALEVMQRFNVKELRSPTNTLRRQANGGMQPLETDQAVPMGLRKVTIMMTGDCYLWLLSLLQGDSHPKHPLLMGAMEAATDAPDAQRIRVALAQQVRCPECKGEVVTTGNCRCERCDGTGHVAQTVPGAKLLARGEHVRLS